MKIENEKFNKFLKEQDVFTALKTAIESDV